MVNMKRNQKWLEEQDLDAIMLATPEAREEYEADRVFARISKTLRRARKESQLSQAEVATLAGIDQRALNRLETTEGVRSAPISVIVKAARAFHLRIDIAFSKEGG